MRKLCLFMMLIVGILTASAQSKDKGVGVHFVYGTEISNFGVGAFYQQHINSNIRLEGGVDYFFKNNEVGLLQVNVTGHYLFDIAPAFQLYPLAGVTVAVPTGEYVDSNAHLGFNLGGGATYDLANDLAIKAELKYTLVKNFDQGVFNVGIVYRF